MNEQINTSDFVKRTYMDTNSPVVISDPFADKVPEDASLIHETPIGETIPTKDPLFPSGVLIAERTLDLPSAGLALAAGAWLHDLAPRRLALAAGLVIALGGARSAVRVPVWRDNRTATMSLLDDAPRSYRSWDYVGWEFLRGGQEERALEAFLQAGRIYPRDARVALAAADAAIGVGLHPLADSLFAHADSVCERCTVSYRNQAMAARLRGATASADSLLARACRLDTP